MKRGAGRCRWGGTGQPPAGSERLSKVMEAARSHGAQVVSKLSGVQRRANPAASLRSVDGAEQPVCATTGWATRFCAGPLGGPGLPVPGMAGDRTLTSLRYGLRGSASRWGECPWPLRPYSGRLLSGRDGLSCCTWQHPCSRGTRGMPLRRTLCGRTGRAS